MKIYLIRHAQSVTNECMIWTGQTDAKLSESGVKEIERVVALFKYPEAELYCSSPMLRCTHTLELIYGRKADILLPNLTECSLGALEGTPYVNLTDDPIYQKWISKPDIPAPGGESFNTFRKRCEGGLQKALGILKERGAASAIIMTHGNVIRAVLCRFADRDVPPGDWKIPNIGGYELDIKASRITSWRTFPDFLFRQQK